MDHLKWDSDICEEYLINLRRMNQRLDEELQKLSMVRKKLLRQGVTDADEALAAILERTEKVMMNLTLANDRIHELRESLSTVSDIFDSTERRIKGMGMDMLYSRMVSTTQSAGTPAPLYTTYTSAFQAGEITPAWLAAITQESSSTSFD